MNYACMCNNVHWLNLQESITNLEISNDMQCMNIEKLVAICFVTNFFPPKTKLYMECNPWDI